MKTQHIFCVYSLAVLAIITLYQFFLKLVEDGAVHQTGAVAVSSGSCAGHMAPASLRGPSLPPPTSSS